MLTVDMDSSLLCVDEKGERVHTYPPTSEKFKHLIPIVKLLKKCIGIPPPPHFPANKITLKKFWIRACLEILVVRGWSLQVYIINKSKYISNGVCVLRGRGL